MEEMHITLEAPAKLNLNLRILRRREDGFHEISTRMVPLALSDRLDISIDSGAPPGNVVFTCDDPSVPAGEDNLVLKAVRAFTRAAGELPGLRIHLAKKIPHGAGLGGGSSDAAAVLQGLNRLALTPLSPHKLHETGAALGSDVPFFLFGQVCDCTGRGEVVSPVEALPPWNPVVLLIKPPFGVPTPWAYREWAGSSPVPGHSREPQVIPWGELVNDLERPVFEKHLVLGLLKTGLNRISGCRALMSGSGSTVFALLEEEGALPEARSVAAEVLGGEHWECVTGFLK